jgi:hypothetical protein
MEEDYDYESEVIEELKEQADFYGVESLTEEEQVLLGFC